MHDRGVRSLETRRNGLALASVLAALLLACTGRIHGTPEGGPGLGSNPGSGEGAKPDSPGQGEQQVTSLPEASPCRTSSPGPRALRRLTALEYAATLRDLFGDPAVPVTSVFSDPSVLGFTVDTRALVIRDLGAQQLMDQAESIAHWAVTTHLDKLTSCSTNDASCRQTFIRQFGKRVHRAPLSDADVALYEGIFQGETTFNDGVEAVTAALLQSPYFLYRRELGTGGASGYQLSAHELASALSYLFTGSMPDAQLFAAADSGALMAADEQERQAERLLQSPRGHEVVGAFVRDWLGLGKLATIAKDDTVFKLTDSLRQAMGEETRRLIDDAIFNQNGSFLSLLTTKKTFLNRELATHYGLPNVDGMTADFVPVTLAAGQRDGGLLAQGSLLTALSTAAESSPVQRGKLVRTRLLCQELPPPPANVNTALKPASGGVTTREHFAEHSSNPVCAACHRKMDPIGFGFEHYDAFGRWRDQDNGRPVDASGYVETDTDRVAFDGLPGLTDYLSNQAGPEVNACLVRYWSYFAFGSPGWSEDQCTYDSITNAAGAEGFALRAVAKSIIKTARFSRRVADP